MSAAPGRGLHSPARLLPLYAIAATLDLGFGSIFALLAEIRNTFDFEASGVAAIGSAGFVSSFAAQVGLARFADRGHTRLMLRVGVLCATFAMLGLVFANSLVEFVAARFLFGAGEGAFIPAARRIVIARDPKRAGESLGLLTASQMSGFLAGPMLASLLNEFFGLRSTFGLLVVLLASLMPLVTRVEVPPGATTTKRRVLRTLLANRGMQSMICAGLGFYGSFGIFEAIWAIYLSDRGASQLVIGATFTLFTLPMIAVTPFAGRLATKHGGMLQAFLGIGASIPCVALYGALESLVLLTLVMTLHAVADAFVMPSSQLAVANVSPPDQLASGQGLFSAVGLAAAALTALASGFVYDRYGPGVLFAGWGLVMAVCLGAALALGRDLLRSPVELRADAASAGSAGS
jgi:MFS family permease